MEFRFLTPKLLAGLSGLDLVAKTVVDGFLAGLHRSPTFGFSQEFAEYRAYSEGDDLRYIDWNVFARTERCYIKRYLGETNCQLTVLIDCSASMFFGSQEVEKIDYARFLAAALFYLANRQRDAAGLLAFDDEVRQCIHPSTRHGQLYRLLHALEQIAPGKRTDYQKPFMKLHDLLRRRGIVVLISDFLAPVDVILPALQPLRYKGFEMILFHVLDPEELEPHLDEPTIFIDKETHERRVVSPEYAKRDYKQKIGQHINELSEKARREGMDYFMLTTDRPLDIALREYLVIREGRM